MTLVWSFKSGRVEVTFEVDQDCSYRYDGDDEDGEVQRKLDCGEYVAFDSKVSVYIDSMEMGVDYLGGSVYEFGKEYEFWTAHRTSPPEYRNTLAQKAMRRCICHYFPGMVHEAIVQARECKRELDKLQAA